LDETRIDGVTGYADKRLRNPQDPYDVVNRRTSILVKFDELATEKAK
jgi:chemotaxis protein MotB